MKRIFICLVLLLGVLFAFLSCGKEAAGKEAISEFQPIETKEKPDTDLEFWICDNADTIDFSNCQARYGIIGGLEYYGSGYMPTKNENGEQIDPEKCVIYTVTSYPDYSSKTHHITRITITDPEISVYGLTVDSSKDEIKNAMLGIGYQLWDTGSQYVIAFKKEDISISFEDSCIRIMAEVSNKLGIVF